MKHAGEVGGAAPVERLAAGQRFHRAVQAAFLSGPMGGQGFRERRWRLVAGGHGRVDLAVETNGAAKALRPPSQRRRNPPHGQATLAYHLQLSTSPQVTRKYPPSWRCHV
jgi:hypothetical protein